MNKQAPVETQAQAKKVSLEERIMFYCHMCLIIRKDIF